MAAVSATPGVPTPFHLEPCPHCGANAELRAHPVYRYQCHVCGGARIPVNRTIARTPPEVTTLLKQVRKRHIARGWWKAAANSLWLMATLAGLLGFGVSRVFNFEAVGLSVVAFLTLVPVVVAVLSKRASNRAAAETKQALGQAWSAMATHVFTLLGGKYTVEDLKAAFGVDTDSALSLVAEAEVAQLLSVAERDATAGSNTPQRVRVAESPLTEEELERQQLEDLRKELGHR